MRAIVSFRDVAGHRPLLALLARSIQQDSLPPSLIFAGPEGVGKQRTALAVAQALNCPVVRDSSGVRHRSGTAVEPAGIDACGVCPSCTRIARGVHPDVLLIKPGDTGSIKIDQVRDAVDRAAYRPFEGRRRVVIIDDADALVAAAQNALLKILEEPPSASVFILVTSRPNRLLDTVRSRCPVLRFGLLDAADVAAVLVALKPTREDAREWTSENARAAAAAAEGSVRRALDAETDEFVEARDAAGAALAAAATSDDPRRRLEAAKELIGPGSSPGRDQLAVRLRAMASILRDVALLSVEGNRLALANGDVLPLLERLAPYGARRAVRAFQTIGRALSALERNASVKIVADWVATEL